MNIWNNHNFPNIKWFTLSIRQKLSDLFITEWHSLLNTSSKCCNYKMFKEIFGFEEYLVKTLSKFLKFIIKFRTRNHRLPVETGSW